jgi:tripartite motif-containing protein 71
MPRLLPAALLALLVCLFPAAARADVIGQSTGGVLRFPQAVAVGPDGSIYVADQFSHAIQVFAPDGTFRRSIGAAGSGPGGLSAVGAVAVAGDGSVYVAAGNDRIDRYAADGTLLDSWGGAGSGVGQFQFGAGVGNESGAGGGIAVANGMVYVADTRNDRIQRFAPDGTHGTVIVPPGRLARPQGIVAVGSRLIVADDDHHRLAVFDTGGRFIRSIGSGPGPQPKQLRNPYDVAADPQGRIYVADNSNHRVVRYGPASSYVYRARWGSYGAGEGQLMYPRGIAVDAAGNSYVADPGNNRIDVFDSGGAPLRTIGISGRVPGQFIAPLGVGADPSGLRAVADSVVGRVQLLNPDGSVAAVFGSPAPGPTLLPDPVAVAFDISGNAYVVDQRRSRVVVFDRTGKIVRTIGSRGSGPGKLLAPSAIAISAGGTVYVADTGNGRISRFTTGGTFIGASGGFSAIRGIALAPDGSRVYASDGGANHVYILTPDGGDIDQIGSGGSKPGRLRSPAGVAVDAAGTIWVADRGNNRVEAFAPDGTLLTVIGSRGTAPGQFISPTGVSVDCHGLITVADADNNRVQQFPGATPAPCVPLPAVQSPPQPLLPTQPAPVPPELTVKAARAHDVLALRSLALNVRCDVPCKLSISGRVLDRKVPKKGRRPSATLHFKSRSLPAGRLTPVRATLAPADVRRLRAKLRRRRGLVAQVKVTASTSDSAPTIVTKTYLVTS